VLKVSLAAASLHRRGRAEYEGQHAASDGGASSAVAARPNTKWLSLLYHQIVAPRRHITATTPPHLKPELTAPPQHHAESRITPWICDGDRWRRWRRVWLPGPRFMPSCIESPNSPHCSWCPVPKAGACR
jgi:hypothetical protein